MSRRRKETFFTSEAVSAGHPDKICDQISDAILDYCLAYDRHSRVAIECLVTGHFLCISGEVTSKAILPEPIIMEIAKRKIQEIGYTEKELGFSFDDLEVVILVHNQSEDIALGVDKGGAGDQGIMFGGATFETNNYLPIPIALATKIMDKYNEYVRTNGISILKPDAKCQVTIKYLDDVPFCIHRVVISANHADIDDEIIKETILNSVLKPALADFIENDIDDTLAGFKTESFSYSINPTGRFVKGGPAADTGVTGRKIICDTYGGYFRHGGGAFSGKDPSKVDRTAAYMARYIAKNMVASEVTDKCEIQLSYIIGENDPCSIRIESNNPEDNEKLEQIAKILFDLTPNGMTNDLGLRDGNVEFSEVAEGCHFRNQNYPWEKVDKALAIEKLYDDLSK